MKGISSRGSSQQKAQGVKKQAFQELKVASHAGSEGGSGEQWGVLGGNQNTGAQLKVCTVGKEGTRKFPDQV